MGELVGAFLLGLAAGIVGTGALAHNWPLMFVNPKKYFLKLQRKVERKLDQYEESSKKEIKAALRKLANAVNLIDLVK